MIEIFFAGGTGFTDTEFPNLNEIPRPILYLMSSIITDPFRQKLLLSAVALGVVMDGIDGSIVNVALPTMATYFDTDTGTIAWVIITYLLMMAGLLLVFGKLADRGIAKKLFLLGFVIFTLGSAACGIAPTLDILLAARLVQGLGAAMIAAVAPLLCIRYLPREMLGTALGVIAATSFHRVCRRAGNRGNPHPAPLVALDLPGQYPDRHHRDPLCSPGDPGR